MSEGEGVCVGEVRDDQRNELRADPPNPGAWECPEIGFEDAEGDSLARARSGEGRRETFRVRVYIILSSPCASTTLIWCSMPWPLEGMMLLTHNYGEGPFTLNHWGCRIK
jgi:hypothetical protein